MKGLILRLSALDADAETAVRVISFFDGLMAAGASARVLVQETARLAECPAGLVDAGLSLAAGEPPGGRRQVREFSESGHVWLGRDAPLPLDDIILDRFAIAARFLLEPAPRDSGEGLAEVALSSEAGELERARALRMLRIEPGAVMRVLAVDGDVAVGGHAVPVGRVRAVLGGALPERVPEGVRVGVGPALPAIEAPVSWRRARTALRFAGLGSDVVHYEGLGALAVVAARMRDEDIAEVADVAVLDELAREPNGAGLIAVLAAFCATGSARRAAAKVHRHHSTIAARLAHAEARLGFAFSAPGGRRRLDLALLLRHLRDTPG